MQNSAPDQSKTLQSAVIYELKTLKKKTASEGLMWLVRYASSHLGFPSPTCTNFRELIGSLIPHRGLDFTSQALRQNLTNASEELSVSFRSAYGTTLKQHHSIIIKPIFSAAMSATPYRRDFYAKMGGEGDQERVRRELSEWVAALENQVGVLKTFLARKDVLGKC